MQIGQNTSDNKATTVCFDEALIRRYDGRGPRYTSYPTALQFDEQFAIDDYLAAVMASNVIRTVTNMSNVLRNQATDGQSRIRLEIA